MKKGMDSFMSLKARPSFVLSGIVIVATGWALKAAVVRLGNVHDELQAEMRQPSQVYLWTRDMRQKAGRSATGSTIKNLDPKFSSTSGEKVSVYQY